MVILFCCLFCFALVLGTPCILAIFCSHEAKGELEDTMISLSAPLLNYVFNRDLAGVSSIYLL